MNDLIQCCFEVYQDLKIEDIKLLNLRGLSGYADHVLIGTAGNQRQMSSLADKLIKTTKEKYKRAPLGIEGLKSEEWVLVDFGEVVCHVFDPEARDLYHLEDLWPNVVPLTENEITKEWFAPVKKKKIKKDASKQTIIKRKTS